LEVGQITFGAFRLEPQERVLWRDGVSIGLGRRTCDMLCALVAAKGALVSKDALMAKVWPGQIIEENALQAQISLLRKALGEAGQRCIITVPGRGYRLVGEGVAVEDIVAAEEAATSAVNAGPKAHGQPSLAVLPFANPSGMSSDEWLADGIAEDLIVELSRSHWFLVISRSSSFTFKGRSVDSRQVGQELGARYVAEGSIRRSGDRLRVAVQLTEAETRTGVWAERYDRALTDLFDIQDEVAHAVSRAIEPAVESAEHIRILRKRPDSLDAWETLQRAKSHQDAEERDRAEKLARRSIELEPGFARAHALLGYFLYSASLTGRLCFREAEAQARAAVGLDENDPLGLAVSAMCVGADNSLLKLQLAARAVELGPSIWHARDAMVDAAISSRRFAEAPQHLAVLNQISPRGTARRVTLMLTALLQLLQGEYRSAAAGARSLTITNPTYTHPYWILISSLGHLGLRDEAQAPLTRWIAIAPQQSAMFAEIGLPFIHPQDMDRIREGLRAAGWNG
jgi:TolB-like protein/Tfp pilus assembly protein PilF